MALSHHFSGICPFLFCFALFLSCVHGTRQLADRDRPSSLPIRLEKSRPNQQILLKDLFRGRVLNSLVQVDEYGEGISLPLSSGPDGNFYVSVGFGTPKRDFTLLFDTGSDLTWIRCNNQTSDFDPSSSSSFSKEVTCHPPTCEYSMVYHDGTSSIGHYVKDTLTIASDLYSNFIFGCSQKVEGDFGEVTGLLGAGPGKLSLAAQTENDYFGLFCYCLPAAENSGGYLVFGVQAYETCQPDSDKMIPITLGSNQIASYFVTLTGITIGQQRLESGYVSSPIKAIIDSGTPITRLPPSLYSALRLAFQGLMSTYPIDPSSGYLDTCYNLQGQSNWTPPKMVLHFEGVDVNLDPSAVTLREKDKVCLAFIGNKNDGDLTIIGNQQHREINVLFDIGNKKLALTSSGCSTE